MRLTENLLCFAIGALLTGIAWAKVRLEYFRDSHTEGRVQRRGKWTTFKPGLRPKKRREIGE